MRRWCICLIVVAWCLVLSGAVPGPSRERRETEQEGAPSGGHGPAVIVDVGSDSQPEGQDSNDVNTDVDVEQGGDGDGFFLNFNPFDGFQSVIDRLRQFEAVMRSMHTRLFNMTSDLPPTYDNSTEEIVEIGGRRYKLVRKVTRRADNDSSIFFSATSLVPVDRRRVSSCGGGTTTSSG